MHYLVTATTQHDVSDIYSWVIFSGTWHHIFGFHDTMVTLTFIWVLCEMDLAFSLSILTLVCIKYVNITLR